MNFLSTIRYVSVGILHGSHFFGLTNSPDFSSIFHSFPVFLEVLFYLKYGAIFAGFSLLLADKFP